MNVLNNNVRLVTLISVPYCGDRTLQQVGFQEPRVICTGVSQTSLRGSLVLSTVAGDK